MLQWLQPLLLCLLIDISSVLALLSDLLLCPTSLRPATALTQRRRAKHGPRSLLFRSCPPLRHDNTIMPPRASCSPVFTPRCLLLRSFLFTLLLLLLVLPIPSVSAASDDVYLVPKTPKGDATLIPGQEVQISWDAYAETKFLTYQQPTTIELVRKRRTPRSERQSILRKIPFYNQNVTVVHTIGTYKQGKGFFDWRVPAYWAGDAPKFGGAYYIRIRPTHLTGRTPDEVEYLNNLPLHNHLFLNTVDDSSLKLEAPPVRDAPPKSDTGGDHEPLEESEDIDYRPGGDSLPSQLETRPTPPRLGDKKDTSAPGPLERYKVQILGCVIGIVVFAVIIVTIVCLGPRRRAHRRRKAAIEAVSKVTDGKFSHLNKDFGAVIDTRHLPAPPHAYHASSQPPPPLLPPPPLPPALQLYPNAGLPPQTSAASTASSASSGSNASHTSTTDYLISPMENGEHYAPYHADPSSSTNGVLASSAVPPTQPIRGILKNANKTFAPPIAPTLERRASRQDTGPADHLWRGRMPLEGIVE